MRACFLSFSLILSAWLLLMSVRFLLLVHMGAELCKVNNQKSLSLSERTPLTPNFSPKRFPSQLCQEHVDLRKSCVEARWRETCCRAAPERVCWHVAQSVDFWTAALEEAENAAGLSVFMRRRAAPQCMAAAVYWRWHWVDNLSCYQTSWEEAGEWGALIHQVIFPSIFHCIISVITHQSRDHNDEIFILAGKFLPDYI